MGRKRKDQTTQVEHRATVTETTNPPNLGVQLEPESIRTSSKERDVNGELGNAKPEGVESPKRRQENIAKSSSKKTARDDSGRVRRSERLLNSALDAPRKDLERMIEDVIECDKEEDPANGEPTELNLNGKTLEEKVEYLILLVEAHQETLDELKSKEIKKTSNESSCPGDLTYRSLYIDSKKKVEALMEENKQLTGKLENALGQIEIYGKGHTSTILEKLKDLMSISSLTKAAEAATFRNAFAVMEGDMPCNTYAKRRKQ